MIGTCCTDINCQYCEGTGIPIESAQMRTVEIGSLWERKNGSIVKVTKSKDYRGQKLFLLVPQSQEKRSRTSWKTEKAILSEMRLHEVP